MKKTLSMLLLVLFAVGLVSCNADAVENLFKDKIQQYTVTFSTNGGSEVQIQEVLSGNKVNKPADPTKGGYTFDGWYKEAACTNEWKFDTDTVTEDTTLYANWTKTIEQIVKTINTGANPDYNALKSEDPGWSNSEKGTKCYIYDGLLYSNLIFPKSDISNPPQINISSATTKIENAYIISSPLNQFTVKFVMNSGKLISIEFTHIDNSFADWDGTYEPVSQPQP